MTPAKLREPRTIPNRGMLLVLALIGTCVAAGCSAKAKAAAMVPDSPPVAKHHAGSASVMVSGSSGEGTELIDNEAFAAALEEALRASQLFSAGAGNSNPAYTLQVLLLSQNNPVFGGNMRSELDTVWTLTRAGESSPVWQTGVRTKHTASFGEAFVGATRLRLAVEGAARENIREGLGRLAEADLGQ